MSKIIIHNESLPDSLAMSCVAKVIQDGMVSEKCGQPQYCFVTTFTNTDIGARYIVIASRNKNGTHTFNVKKEAITS